MNPRHVGRAGCLASALVAIGCSSASAPLNAAEAEELMGEAERLERQGDPEQAFRAYLRCFEQCKGSVREIAAANTFRLARGDVGAGRLLAAALAEVERRVITAAYDSEELVDDLLTLTAAYSVQSSVGSVDVLLAKMLGASKGPVRDEALRTFAHLSPEAIGALSESDSNVLLADVAAAPFAEKAMALPASGVDEIRHLRLSVAASYLVLFMRLGKKNEGTKVVDLVVGGARVDACGEFVDKVAQLESLPALQTVCGVCEAAPQCPTKESPGSAAPPGTLEP